MPLCWSIESSICLSKFLLSCFCCWSLRKCFKASKVSAAAGMQVCGSTPTLQHNQLSSTSMIKDLLWLVTAPCSCNCLLRRESGNGNSEYGNRVLPEALTRAGLCTESSQLKLSTSSSIHPFQDRVCVCRFLESLPGVSPTACLYLVLLEELKP